ncbi:TIR domain-containing protein [Apibacter raozihei]|uniref:toll/interleukin-1 receptor domain-containing protein n=1 Tax=Apibacter raozihei TaxID=2500547 RepID=UPI000FE2F585|nr:TIR domain-containing protein [Apibacter raozihei]
MEYKYQVALSFAGEDREYVEKVALILKENKISVFYDKFDELDLWGKDLGIHFDYIYRRQSKYFIPFISSFYKEKIWTNFEIRNALARSIENKEEYILPVKFDDTELDGLRSTIGFINIKNMQPEELADRILKKLGSEVNIPIPEKEISESNIYLSIYILVNSFGISEICIGVTVTNIIKEHRYFHAPYFTISQPVIGSADTFQLVESINHIEFPIKMEYGEQYQIKYKLVEGFFKQFEKFIGKGVTITAYVTTTIGEKFSSNPMPVDDIFKFKK